MIYYPQVAADQYMFSVLSDELTDNEADNALTALSTLTSLYPALFPSEHTFVRPDHQRGVDGPSGVRFVVFGEDGVVRMVRLPRQDLSSLTEAIETIMIMVSILNQKAA